MFKKGNWINWRITGDWVPGSAGAHVYRLYIEHITCGSQDQKKQFLKYNYKHEKITKNNLMHFDNSNKETKFPKIFVFYSR